MTGTSLIMICIGVLVKKSSHQDISNNNVRHNIIGQNGCHTHTQLIVLSTISMKLHLSSTPFKNHACGSLISN